MAILGSLGRSLGRSAHAKAIGGSHWSGTRAFALCPFVHLREVRAPVAEGSLGKLWVDAASTLDFSVRYTTLMENNVRYPTNVVFSSLIKTTYVVAIGIPSITDQKFILKARRIYPQRDVWKVGTAKSNWVCHFFAINMATVVTPKILDNPNSYCWIY